MDNIKVAVITSGASSFGLISYLAQIEKLSGVLIFGPWDQEKAHIAQQLSQSGIAVKHCTTDDIDPPITALTGWESQLAIVFCCREKIPLSVANTPKYGTINLHGSPLPNYRGPDPIYWQIRNGETQSALTAHRLAEDFDTGAIVAQHPFAIGPYDTASRVFSNLTQQIPELLTQIFDQIRQHGEVPEQPQQEEVQYLGTRVSEQDLKVLWHQTTARDLCNQIRAGNPQHGGVRLTMGQEQVQLLQATPSNLPNYGAHAGSIIHISPEQGLIVALKEESVRLDIIANNDGVVDGYRFAKLCHLSAGMRFI
ncbi:methionyl-tRNA formyltransferase [Terasakiella pusilla]|uniref:methionyl-tRNA formyltransferase n=1 Tax=Terasakiella pusilla TaxID=64973 RepID=UPI003AA87918